MEPLDKNYLRLQFWKEVYRKNATEFQSFFEDIMEKAFYDVYNMHKEKKSMGEDNLERLKKENLLLRKETMVYKAFIDSSIKGFIEHRADRIVDALATWWPESKLTWARANLVAEKWLKPLSDLKK